MMGVGNIVQARMLHHNRIDLQHKIMSHHVRKFYKRRTGELLYSVGFKGGIRDAPSRSKVFHSHAKILQNKKLVLTPPLLEILDPPLL